VECRVEEVKTRVEAARRSTIGAQSTEQRSAIFHRALFRTRNAYNILKVAAGTVKKSIETISPTWLVSVSCQLK
jgi:hypothetical protein